MNDARRQKCQMRKDKIKTGWKLTDHKGPRVPHLVHVAKCMESKGRVSINVSWQWNNGKEREKDGDVMMVDVDPCPPSPTLGEKKKKEKKKESSLGKR